MVPMIMTWAFGVPAPMSHGPPLTIVEGMPVVAVVANGM
jgi:hypothetical protein